MSDVIPTKSSDEIFCSSCGKPIKKEAEICVHCGVRNAASSSARTGVARVDESSKSRTAALLLCLFFGVLGVHRFYVGKTGSGIFQLLIGGWGTLGIWPLIDLIIIISGGFRDRDGKLVVNWGS